MEARPNYLSLEQAAALAPGTRVRLLREAAGYVFEDDICLEGIVLPPGTPMTVRHLIQGRFGCTLGLASDEEVYLTLDEGDDDGRFPLAIVEAAP